MTREHETAFFCDRMAGSLCKYLRFMGYDCRDANDLPNGNPREDTEILQIAERENRYILTQDAELARRGGDHAIRLVSSDLAGQIRQLADAGLISPEIRLTRCSRCNALLRKGISPHAKDPVTPDTASLMYCPVCHRQYWEGSHTRNMRDQLMRMLHGTE